MGPRPTRVFAIVLLPCALILTGYRIHSAAAAPSDFTQDYIAARSLLLGRSIYKTYTSREIRSITHGIISPTTNQPSAAISNYHPPSSVLLVVPFALLQYPHAFFAWAVLTICAFALALRLVITKICLHQLRWDLQLIALSLWLMWTPVQTHLVMGQWTHLVLLSVCIFWHSLRSNTKGMPALAGVLLAVVIATRLTPIILAPLLLHPNAARQRQPFLLSALAITFATILAVGYDDTALYISTISAESIRRFGDGPFNFSLSAIVLRTFRSTSYSSPLFDAGAIADMLAQTVCAFGLCAVLLRLTMERPAITSSLDYNMALACLSMLLFTPLLWIQRLTLLLVPLAVVCIHRSQRHRGLAIAAAVAAISQIPFDRLAQAAIVANHPDKLNPMQTLVYVPIPLTLLLLLPEIERIRHLAIRSKAAQ